MRDDMRSALRPQRSVQRLLQIEMDGQPKA